jgi:hypothetical protein
MLSVKRQENAGRHKGLDRVADKKSRSGKDLPKRPKDDF